MAVHLLCPVGKHIATTLYRVNGVAADFPALLDQRGTGRDDIAWLALAVHDDGVGEGLQQHWQRTKMHRCFHDPAALGVAVLPLQVLQHLIGHLVAAALITAGNVAIERRHAGKQQGDNAVDGHLHHTLFFVRLVGLHGVAAHPVGKVL